MSAKKPSAPAGMQFSDKGKAKFLADVRNETNASKAAAPEPKGFVRGARVRLRPPSG